MLFFDTSHDARQLQKARFTEHQAEVQMDVLRTLIENDLATKQDIASLQDEIAKLKVMVEESKHAVGTQPQEQPSQDDKRQMLEEEFKTTVNMLLMCRKKIDTEQAQGK